MKLNEIQLSILKTIKSIEDNYYNVVPQTLSPQSIGDSQLASYLNLDISLIGHYLDVMKEQGCISFLESSSHSNPRKSRVSIKLTDKGVVAITNPDNLINEDNLTMNNITFTGPINAPIGVLQNSDNNTINITQNNNQNIQEIINSLEFLEKEVQVFPEEEKQEALVYLDQLKTEIKDSKNPAKIRTFFKGFLKIAIPLATLIINGADFANNVTDLATKFDVDISQIALPFK